MSSEDYLIRYFRQLGGVIAAIFDFRKRKMYSEAIEEIDTALKTWFKIDPDHLKDKGDDFLIDISNNPTDKLEAKKSIAELFYQKAVTFRLMGKIEESTHTAKIALRIYKEIDSSSGEYSIENQQKIAELDQMVTKI